MSNPKVSVNICCYNSEKFIKETIQSVLDQTFKNFEIVIIDDGSKDTTEEAIKSFKDSRIHYFYHKNCGLSSSRNRAIELSSGEYIALLDHDDLWEPKKLELQVELLDSKVDIGLVYSDAYFIDSNNNITSQFFNLCIPQRKKVTQFLIQNNFIPCLTVLMRKDVMLKTAPFSIDMKIAEEYEYFIRLSEITNFDFINLPLARYRLHSNNASKNIVNSFEEEVNIRSHFKDLIIDREILKKTEQVITKYRTFLARTYLGRGDILAARKEITHALKSDPNLYKCFIYIASFLPKSFIVRIKQFKSTIRRCK